MKIIKMNKVLKISCSKIRITILNKILLVLLLSIFSVNFSYTQEKKKSYKYSIELINTLSNYQKELIDKERKYLKKQREAIRKLFNRTKKMIADSTISDKEKRVKIIKSFSSSQKER